MTESVVGKLSKALAADGPVFSAWVGTNEPAVAETLAREAFDAVILDMQHGALDFAGASAVDSRRRARRPACDRARAGRRISRPRAGFSTRAPPASSRR